MKKMVLLFILSLPFSTSYATDNCPPVQMVAAHTSFNSAQKVPGSGVWTLEDMSSYQFEGENWYTGFAISLSDDVTTEADALQKGRAFFNSQVQLQDPQMMNGLCAYAYEFDNNRESFYAVVSIKEADMPPMKKMSVFGR